MTVFLLTTGDGSDGSEWNVEGIYATRELAEKARQIYQAPRPRGDGSFWSATADVEEWEVLTEAV